MHTHPPRATGLLGVAALTLTFVLLAWPVATPRNNEGESPPDYNCGTPVAYALGWSGDGWRIADGLNFRFGDTGDYRKGVVCMQAMAPFLAATTLALLLALVPALWFTLRTSILVDLRGRGTAVSDDEDVE